jgi:hypothetical protein
MMVPVLFRNITVALVRIADYSASSPRKHPGINWRVSPMAPFERLPPDMLVRPTVNINGTSRDELIRNLGDAAAAIGSALYALNKCAPHGRDYPDTAAFLMPLAAAQHMRRASALTVIARELTDLAEGI